MMRRIRARLTYANVMATIAVFAAIGGTSYAALKLPNNSVKSATIKDHQVKQQDLATGAVSNTKIKNGAVGNSKLADISVTTTKLADAAVTTSKLADTSVTTAKLADNGVTGPKVNEPSLQGFGCVPGDYQGGAGLCAYRADASSGRTWAQAVAICTAHDNDATLPTMGQIQALSTQTGSPFTSMTVWSADSAGGGATPAAYIVSLSSTDVTSTSALAISNNTTITQIACVYEPASKGG